MPTGAEITLWIAFSAGVLSFFSPCVLPLIPSYLTYITGISFGQLKESQPDAKVRFAVVFHSLAFIVGFSIVFIALGGLAGWASHSFQSYLRDWLGVIQKVGGVLIFLFGIHMTGLLHFGMLLGEKRVHLARKPTGVLGTLLVGIAFAAGWTPCIGPILGAILALAASTTGGVSEGIYLLSAYSAGLGIPFFISGLMFHGFLSFFNRFKRHIRIMEIITGVLLMVVGIMLFFNMFAFMTGYLYEWLPMLG
ncbi:cytochrome c biogenesis CcdA family protein [Geoalkalibacter halelectricus]|uniref:Cytochrome c biogenesis protein CcdA n=1 Tax=Geoalkalibacter halelectricus TaxID=2847045 RepID=A0ABY5ZMV4_9BACT|nr:cytochrome c biogenesis protein CcdA [Geoalkalibacter halelectricus]MDO3379608.1 cytochrome c biogenesis protein CcdA [Geoalkalibacter halelectricus]UWZ78576.1 cytochrome c biogenesis protein CcdA [Geoalkalibacter halelectricus]